MEYPQFVNHNGLTADGIKLVAWLDAYCESMDEKKGNMSLSGHIGHFYVNVHKMESLNPRQWVEQFEHSAARSAWDDMLYFEAQETARQDAAEAKEATNELTEALEQIKAELAEVRKELKTTRAQKTRLANKLAAVEEAEEVEAEEEPAVEEDEPTEDEPETAEEEDTAADEQPEADGEEA